MKKDNVFISYRREGGIYLAMHIKNALQERGYAVFMDIEDLRNGPFNSALYEKIEDTPNFIIILSKGALDRCYKISDWVRKEIAHAIKCNRNIVPIIELGFIMPAASALPGDISDIGLGKK